MKLTVLILAIVFASWSQYTDASMQKEFRTLVPYTLEEFRPGYLWSVAESSILETGGGEGVQIMKSTFIKNDMVGEGEYSHRVFHLDTKVPPVFSELAGGVLKVYEESWTALDYVKTEYRENNVMGDDFHFTIKTKYVDDDDCGRDDVHPESGSAEVVHIDFTVDIPPKEQEYWDPTRCSSVKLKRGPLTSGWQSETPRMCIYSYVDVEFDWAAFQSVVESRIVDAYQGIVEKFHRQMFCWADKWAGISMEEVDRKEKQTKAELNRIRSKGKPRGVKEGIYPN